MSDGPALLPAPHGEAPHEPRPRRDSMSLLAVLGVVALAGAIFWVWQGPDRALRDDVATLGQRLDLVEQRQGAAAPGTDAGAMAALGRRVAALEQRPAASGAAPDLGPLEEKVAALEQSVGEQRVGEQRAGVSPDAVEQLDRRVKAIEDEPAPADVGPLDRRVTALEQRPAPEAADLSPLEQRVAALEARQAPDLAPLEQRIAALEARKPAVEAATKAEMAALAGRLDAIGGREDQLAARAQGLETGVQGRLDALDQRVSQARDAAEGLPAVKGAVAALTGEVDALRKGEGEVPEIAARETRLARLASARAALDAGQGVGDLPDAPPALAKFATDKPPTEASLRLSFPEAARAAEAAGEPSADAPLGQRIWQRVQAPFTIKQGDKVVLGSPTAATLAAARRALDAGDLAAAADAVGGLRGGAATAMAPWLARARDLLAARSALAEMAAHA